MLPIKPTAGHYTGGVDQRVRFDQIQVTKLSLNTSLLIIFNTSDSERRVSLISSTSFELSFFSNKSEEHHGGQIKLDSEIARASRRLWRVLSKVRVSLVFPRVCAGAVRVNQYPAESRGLSIDFTVNIKYSVLGWRGFSVCY